RLALGGGAREHHPVALLHERSAQLQRRRLVVRHEEQREPRLGGLRRAEGAEAGDRVLHARQLEEEGRALADDARHADGAAVLLDDRLRDREAEPAAALLAPVALVDLLELAEQPAEARLRDAGALVADLPAHRLRLL